MKVIYKGKGNLKSKGISFTPDINEYDVKDEDGKYLINTFSNLFEEIIEKKIEPKKQAPKRTPKSKDE